jgi:hypothetical protein
VTRFCNHAIAGFAKRSLDPRCEVVSDGLACFSGVTDAGCMHQVIKTGSGPTAARTPAFKWVNTALGNIKAALVGTYRSIHEKHVPRYLAEFEYRFTVTDATTSLPCCRASPGPPCVLHPCPTVF